MRQTCPHGAHSLLGRQAHKRWFQYNNMVNSGKKPISELWGQGGQRTLWEDMLPELQLKKPVKLSKSRISREETGGVKISQEGLEWAKRTNDIASLLKPPQVHGIRMTLTQSAPRQRAAPHRHPISVELAWFTLMWESGDWKGQRSNPQKSTIQFPPFFQYLSFYSLQHIKTSLKCYFT